MKYSKGYWKFGKRLNELHITPKEWALPLYVTLESYSINIHILCFMFIIKYN